MAIFFKKMISKVRSRVDRSWVLVTLLFFCTASFAHAECYEYDEQGRLVEVVFDNTEGSSLTYVYDAHGNRLKVDTDFDAGVSCTVPSGSNSLGVTSPTSSATPTYQTQSSSSQSQLPQPVDDILYMAPSTSIYDAPLTANDIPYNLLTITAVDTTGTLGTVTFDSQNGTVDYTSPTVPTGSPNGKITDSFGYTVEDSSQNLATATVMITVDENYSGPGGGGSGPGAGCTGNECE